jgi:hypothetical protein
VFENLVEMLMRIAVLSLALSVTSVAAGSQAGSALRIVVIEGEDAVNIIQQKTAVAPVIEVRDRNDQPVAGAIVNFAIRSGRATFGGARTLSVTTNAAGRAIAAGFTPTGSGALQISATAAFQGQTAAAVTIAQTTVQTAAQAAAVGGASSAGAGGSNGGTSAGAGAGGGGGGLSGTTIGIVGAAAAGGVLAATQAGSGPPPPTTRTYTGQFTGTLPMTFPRGQSCTRNEAHTGTLDMDLTDDNGAISGAARIRANVVITPGTCDPTAAPNNGTDGFEMQATPVAASGDSLTFNGSASNTFPAGAFGPAGLNSYQYSFNGTISGGQITGTLTVHREIGGPLGTAGNGTGTVSDSVTLR